MPLVAHHLAPVPARREAGGDRAQAAHQGRLRHHRQRGGGERGAHHARGRRPRPPLRHHLPGQLPRRQLRHRRHGPAQRPLQPRHRAVHERLDQRPLPDLLPLPVPPRLPGLRHRLPRLHRGDDPEVQGDARQHRRRQRGVHPGRERHPDPAAGVAQAAVRPLQEVRLDPLQRRGPGGHGPLRRVVPHRRVPGRGGRAALARQGHVRRPDPHLLHAGVGPHERAGRRALHRRHLRRLSRRLRRRHQAHRAHQARQRAGQRQGDRDGRQGEVRRHEGQVRDRRRRARQGLLPVPSSSSRTRTPRRRPTTSRARWSTPWSGAA